MNAEQRPKQADTHTHTDAPRPSPEEWVERVASYWGRAVVDAWRTVFPHREGTR